MNVDFGASIDAIFALLNPAAAPTEPGSSASTPIAFPFQLATATPTLRLGSTVNLQTNAATLSPQANVATSTIVAPTPDAATAGIADELLAQLTVLQLRLERSVVSETPSRNVAPSTPNSDESLEPTGAIDSLQITETIDVELTAVESATIDAACGPGAIHPCDDSTSSTPTEPLPTADIASSPSSALESTLGHLLRQLAQSPFGRSSKNVVNPFESLTLGDDQRASASIGQQGQAAIPGGSVPTQHAITALSTSLADEEPTEPAPPDRASAILVTSPVPVDANRGSPSAPWLLTAALQPPAAAPAHPDTKFSLPQASAGADRHNATSPGEEAPPVNASPWSRSAALIPRETLIPREQKSTDPKPVVSPIPTLNAETASNSSAPIAAAPNVGPPIPTSQPLAIRIENPAAIGSDILPASPAVPLPIDQARGELAAPHGDSAIPRIVADVHSTLPTRTAIDDAHADDATSNVEAQLGSTEPAPITASNDVRPDIQAKPDVESQPVDAAARRAISTTHRGDVPQNSAVQRDSDLLKRGERATSAVTPTAPSRREAPVTAPEPATRLPLESESFETSASTSAFRPEPIPESQSATPRATAASSDSRSNVSSDATNADADSSESRDAREDAPALADLITTQSVVPTSPIPRDLVSPTRIALDRGAARLTEAGSPVGGSRGDVPTIDDGTTEPAATNLVDAAERGDVNSSSFESTLAAARGHGPDVGGMAGTESTQGRHPSNAVNAPSMIDRIANAILERPAGPEFSVQLTPPDLGSLRIDLVRRDGELTVSFGVENVRAEQLLVDSLPQLREMLHDQGLRIDRTDVYRFDQGAAAFSQQNAESRQSPSQHAPGQEATAELRQASREERRTQDVDEARRLATLEQRGRRTALDRINVRI